MKLRFDLLKNLTPEMILESALANQHRYKAEPQLSKTGVGFLAPATPEDVAAEIAMCEKLTRKLEKLSRKTSKSRRRTKKSC